MTGAAAQDCGQHSGRTVLAIALAGFASFWLLFGAQPLLPQIAREFGVTPAAASCGKSSTRSAPASLSAAAGMMPQLARCGSCTQALPPSCRTRASPAAPSAEAPVRMMASMARR